MCECYISHEMVGKKLQQEVRPMGHGARCGAARWHLCQVVAACIQLGAAVVSREGGETEAS